MSILFRLSIILVLAVSQILAKDIVSRSWQPGKKDINGIRMTGTEIVKIAAHKGKLYAGTSMWMESDPSLGGCQVLVKDTPAAEWKVDHEFGKKSTRITSLVSFVFSTDYTGKKIKPTRILMAGPNLKKGGKFHIFTRKDKTGDWASILLGKVKGTTQIRGIGFYRDKITGIDMAFAGVSGTKNAKALSLGLLTGSYKKGAKGKLIWTKKPEMILPRGQRFMEFTECNGVLYASSTKNIFVRTDGPNPTWKSVFFDKKQNSGAGIRGLATVPRLDGKGEEILFLSFEKIFRLDPLNQFDVSLDLDIPEFLTKQWNMPVIGALAGYNKIVDYIWPDGEKSWLLGFQSDYLPSFIENSRPKNLQIKVRDDGRRRIKYFAAEGRFLIRRVRKGNPVYEIKTITDSTKPILGAARTIVRSPFPGEKQSVLYVGGQDGNGIPAHDSGWIFRVELEN